MDLLGLWDRAARARGPERALVLAGAPERAEAPLGQLHALLLTLHDELSGPTLAATVPCPECAEIVEFTLSTVELLPLADKIDTTPPPVVYGGWTVTWRPPSARDLMVIDDEWDLLDRCVSEARSPEGATVSGRRLDPAVRAVLAAAMADADPLAEMLVDLRCPDCDAEFGTEIDPADFVWTELDARARRLLLEVDTLAREYGWAERDVLALSESRRAAYLRIIAEGAP